MKYIDLVFLVFFLFSIKCSAQYFEGIISYKFTEKPKTEFGLMYYGKPIIYTIKNDKIRREHSEQFFDYYRIYSNTKSGEIISCEIDTIQKYFEILISKIEDGDLYSFHKYPKKYKKQKINKEQILGYDCKHYYTINNNFPIPYRFDFWITDVIVPKINVAGLFIKNRGIILKSHFKSRASELIKEVVSIEPKPISSELFEIPADCKARKSKIPAAMKKYGVDKKSISRDSLRHVKDTATKIDLGKWGEDN